MSDYYDSESYTPPRQISPEERQRQQINAAVAAAVSTANAQNKAEMNRLKRQHELEQQQITQKLNSLSGQFKDTIIQHQQQLNKMREQYDAQLKEAIEKADRERIRERAEAEAKRLLDKKQLEKELNEAVEIVNANVEDLRKSTQRALDATNSNLNNLRIETRNALNKQQIQIDSIVEEVHNDKAKAQAMKQALLEAYQEQLSIVSAKNHRKYAPNQIEAIEARLNGVSALPDVAACAILNTAFNDLLTLDDDIERAKMEYEAKHLLTLKAAQEVLTRMHENRKKITVTDGENNVATDENGEIIRLELDFWTEGEYGKKENELRGIIDTISKGLDRPDYTVNDLDNALLQIQKIDEEQNNMVVESIQQGNASQIRAEMADAIVQHLEGQRFQVIERGYEHGDARNAYFIKLDDGTSVIVVAVNPENNEKNIIIRKTIDTDLSEPDLLQLNKDLDNAMEEAGLTIKGGACKKRDSGSDQAWREIYDMDVVSQDIPSETKERARLRDVRKERNKRSE